MVNANIGALALAPQNMVVPQINGGTLGFTLTTGSTQILNQNTQAQKVTFHNPGTVSVFVCQATDLNGNALTPGALPGNWQIFPGGLLIVTGNGVGSAWLGAAETETNPITIAVSQTL